VIPIPPILVLFYAIAHTLGGVATGAVSGFVASLAVKSKKRHAIRHAFLGVLGFWVGFIGCLFMPWPENTITYYVGHTKVQETATHYQHPFIVGYAVAILLPVLYEIIRLRQSRSAAGRVPA
jgi:Na+-driven multidrug efflux pump